MKRIYTTSFGKEAKLPLDVRRISIALSTPTWCRVDGHAEELAPSGAAFAMAKSDEAGAWKDAYRRHILRDPNGLRMVYDRLADQSVLLCWEKDWNECHRKIAWEVLAERFGAEGGEWAFEEVLSKEEQFRRRQGGLFK